MPLDDFADGDSPSGAGVFRLGAAARSMHPFADRDVPESQGSSWADKCLWPVANRNVKQTALLPGV